MLGQGDALDGVQLPGIDGLVEGDQVVFESGYGFSFLDAHDSEILGGEAVAAGVLGGASFALEGAGAGGVGGLGAIGGELLGRDGAFVRGCF